MSINTNHVWIAAIIGFTVAVCILIVSIAWNDTHGDGDEGETIRVCIKAGKSWTYKEFGTELKGECQ